MKSNRAPNVVYIYADDLGRGMLSCYGQKLIETPNIDRIAAEGIRFTNSYGCVFCAPARASLLLGRHDCHAGYWSITTAGVYPALSTGEVSYEDLRETINNTGIQAGENDVFLPELFQQAGYVTGQVGKLEWGFATTPERIARHGWDYHYGYYDHVRCHGFYPPFLFEDGERIDIPGNTHPDCAKHPQAESPENHAIRWDMTGKAVYSQDLFDEKVLQFIRDHQDEPFFLYHPSQLPHGPVSISEIAEEVRDHPELTQFDQEYASMILRSDRTVGLILDELDALGLADNTMVCFSSDNGHQVYCQQPGRTGGVAQTADGSRIDNVTTKFYSALCGDVFDGNDGMAGLKTTNWEGGARIPFLIRWPGIVEPGAVSDHMFANYDLFATFAEMLRASVPTEKDSVSLLPTIEGRTADQDQHGYVVYSSFTHGPSLVNQDGWKLRRINHLDLFQLYYLPDDYREECDLAGEHPERVRELAAKMLEACDGDYGNGHIGSHRVEYTDEAVLAFLEQSRREVIAGRTGR